MLSSIPQAEQDACPAHLPPVSTPYSLAVYKTGTSLYRKYLLLLSVPCSSLSQNQSMGCLLSLNRCYFLLSSLHLSQYLCGSLGCERANMIPHRSHLWPIMTFGLSVSFFFSYSLLLNPSSLSKLFIVLQVLSLYADDRCTSC